MDALVISRRNLIMSSAAVVLATGLSSSPLRVGAQATPSGRIPLKDAMATLSPGPVFENFYDLTQIPRQSHKEAQVSAFLAEFGQNLGLETEVNEVGNVVIRKPATVGMEDRQGVVLQAHMDMVPVRSPGSDHNFDTDPIDAYVEDGWVRAEDTTLGADDGIGVAMIMAILQSDEIEHGPLEALFTVNEEDGFTGADAVGPGLLRGANLINVDSEEEGVFTIGSAGGVNVDASMTYSEEATPTGMAGARVTVSGLQGGHSGVDIDKGRGNAIKLLARLINEIEGEIDLRLASASGGDRYNAIPRESTAVVAVPAAELARLLDLVDIFAETVRSELAGTEPEIEITATPKESPSQVMDLDAQRRIIDAFNGSPNGVIRMSDSVPGLVETSTNLGTMSVADGRLEAGMLVRSSVDSSRDAVRESIASVFELAGAQVSTHDEYSGWPPNPDSPLLALLQETYFDLFGSDAGVMAVHAGLETSEFAATYPDMDMISLGPTLQNVHSPDEQLDIASVDKTWQLLIKALGRIPA